MGDGLSPQVITKEQLFRQLPPEWAEEDLLAQIRQGLLQSGRKVVVLDDDPTGSQTVHGIVLRTSWAVDELKDSLRSSESLFFILTNTRSMPVEKARAVNAEIARNLCRAASESGVDFTLISRGDSTLRWYYPDELDVLEEVLGKDAGMNFDGQILIPAFFEGGRYTIDDIHYVQEGDSLIPADQTEFARDSVFGYLSSHLPHYVEEKTCGFVPAAEVVSLGLATIRQSGPQGVSDLLIGIPSGRTIIVNAACYRDLEVFVAGLLIAEHAGKRYLVRSSASFVRVRGGINSRPLLTHAELTAQHGAAHGGLIVAGSYVGKTSGQIDSAKELPGLQTVEISVSLLLEENERSAEIERVSTCLQNYIQEGQDVMIYTSRTVISRTGEAENLSIGLRISSALIEIVSSLSIRPAFLIAKGGITSNDVATESLGVKAAKVLGQVSPGISAWQLGTETKFPGMSYVVFPGNVGTRETLSAVISVMRGTVSQL